MDPEEFPDLRLRSFPEKRLQYHLKLLQKDFVLSQVEI